MIPEPRKTQEIASLIRDVDKLPTVPLTYLRLAELAAKPNLNLAEIAEVLESDPGVSANLLQLVNSVFYGPTQRIATIQQAVTRLGLDAIKALVVCAHVFRSHSSVAGLSLELFQAHSVNVARLARDFVSPPRRDEAFTTGLVHDIGKLVIALRDPEGAQRVTDESADSPDEVFQLERRFVGMDHAEAGAFLLARWQIPRTVVEAVRFHHQPSLAAPDEVLAAVHAADALIGIVTRGETWCRLDEGFLAVAGVHDRLPRWCELAQAT